MRWDDERYVRVYTRDTPSWCLLSWEARSIFVLLLRVVDRAGMLHIGPAGARAVAAVLRAPEEVVERALVELVEDGCVQLKKTWLVIPNFTAAQETAQNDAARKRASRERAKARALDGSDDPPADAASGPVTDGHSVLCCADPIRTDPDPLLRAPARIESDPVAAESGEASLRHDQKEGLLPSEQTSDPEGFGEQEPPLTLAETYAAVEARPAGELDTLARDLAAEGNPFGVRCAGYLDSGAALPHGMRAKLREILDERSRPRPSGVRRTLSLSAEEQALVAAYVAAQKRCRKVETAQLDLHGRAAQRALPDLQTLAGSLRREGFAPTALDVWEHKLEQYFGINDARLGEQGYPMPLVLSRTDGLELPRPKRKRDPPPGPTIVQAEPRPTAEALAAAQKKFGLSDAAIAHLREGTGT